MDSVPSKNKAMNKDENHCVEELIEVNKIITANDTNATTNKLKDEAWVSRAANLNARNESIPRQKDQLNSKWDNLKKSARKRTQHMRVNHLQTGGGKPDDTLDELESLLGSTCNGFVVPFGGDCVGDTKIVVKVLDEYGDGSACLSTDMDDKTSTNDLNLTATTSAGQKRKANKDVQRRILFSMPTTSNSLQTKEKRSKETDDSRQQLNLAAKKYYDKKAEKIELEIKLLRIELANKENNCNCNLNK